MSDTPPANPSLAPDSGSAQDNMASHLDALVRVRAYCNALLHTDLVWNDDEGPAPDWFTKLVADFTTAKTHAGTWAAIEQAMVSTLPQSLIDYGTLFNTATGDILNTLASTNNQPSAAQSATIADTMTAILTELTSHKNDIIALATQFGTFETNVGTDYNTLSSGNNEIQKALNVEQKDINDINGKIAVINAEIAKDQAAVIASAVAAGVGLVAGSAAMALGAETMGITFVIGCFVLAGAVAALGTMAAYVVKLGKARNELQDEQDKLDGDKKIVVSLQLLQDSITKLTEKNKAMADALSAIGDWFATVETKTDSVIKDMRSAQNYESKNFWIMVKIEIQTAQTAWTQLVDFATKYQEAAAGIDTQPAVQPGTAA